MGGDKRGNKRGKMSSFPDPLELDKVAKTWEDEEPSVFERITAVPGEVPDAPPDGSGGGGDDPKSGLHQRQTPERGVPAPREPRRDDDLPPVLGAPSSSKSRPKSEKPEESWRKTGTRRTAPARRPVLELDLDDVDSKVPPPPHPRAHALEAPLPARPTVPDRLPVSQPQTSPQVLDMRDRYATGDFSGALVVAEGLLETDPQHEEARRCQERCTEVLSQMYLARLGSPAQRVRVAVPNDQVKWLSLDHRAGFLLSLIDGRLTIEELLDISGMPRLDALRILYGLLDQRVIALA